MDQNQPINMNKTENNIQNTNIYTIDKNSQNLDEHPLVIEAAQKLKNNEVVAFPTETVYGLGANALSDDAIHHIFQAKGRPSDNPLIVHIARQDQLTNYVTSISPNAQQLMDEFWPGPLTLVLEHTGKLSPKVTANLSTVAVRMPDHPIALAILRAANLPIAAPSANTSGRPSPTTAAHVYDDLKGKITTIVDGGTTGVGVESTVVDCTGNQIMILRPGGVTKEAMETIVGQVTIDPALTKETEAPKSPGMKYTHYAPDAPLVLIDGDTTYFQAQVTKATASGKKVGVLVSEENENLINGVKKVILGSRNDLSTIASSLYESLRTFNANEVDIIFSEVFPEEGIGVAIMNRLKKASGNTILEESKEN